MIRDQRGVGMLALLQQRGAADAGDGFHAVEAKEHLVAHHRAAGGEGKSVEAGMRANGRKQSRDMQRLGAFADELDVIDMRLVADHKLQRRVNLVVGIPRAFMALNQHDPGALLNHDKRACEDRGRRIGTDESQMQRAVDHRPRRDVHESAIAHQRGIERQRRVVAGDDLAEMPRDKRVTLRQHRRHRADGQTLFQGAEIGKLGNESAVDEDDAAAFHIADRASGRFGARLGGGVGRRGQRLGLAHQRAQVGIFPFLDAPMRQSARIKAAESALAQGGDRPAARQLLLHRGKGIGERKLGRGLQGFDFDVHRIILYCRHPGTP